MSVLSFDGDIGTWDMAEENHDNSVSQYADTCQAALATVSSPTTQHDDKHSHTIVLLCN